MAAPFDPYYLWLGIPADEQPANHYRLLGIKLFETSLEVIENAADRQIGHLRTFQIGKDSDLSQTLLNEVAAAKVCLLQPLKKAAYDQQLRRRLATEKAKQLEPPSPVGPPRVPPPRAVAPPPLPDPVFEALEADTVDFASLTADMSTAASRRLPPRSRRIGSQVWVALGTATALLVMGILWVIVTPSSNRQTPPNEPSPALTATRLPAEGAKNNAVNSSDIESPKAPQRGSAAATETAPSSGAVDRPTTTPETARAETARPADASSADLHAGPAVPNMPAAKVESMVAPGSLSNNSATPVASPAQPPSPTATPRDASHGSELAVKDKDKAAPAEAAAKVEASAGGENATSPPATAAMEPKKATANDLVAQSFWEEIRGNWSQGNPTNLARVKVDEFNRIYAGKSLEIAFKVVDQHFNDRQKKAVVDIAPDPLIPLDCQPYFRHQVLLPLSRQNLASLGSGMSLVLRGKVSFSFGTCPACHGTHEMTCPKCTGGRVLLPRNPNAVYLKPPTAICRYCHGRGTVTCEFCGSEGESHQVVGHDFESWDVFRLVKAKGAPVGLAPWNAVLFLSRSQGTNRCYLVLEDLTVAIRSATGEVAVTKHGLPTP